ncbi:dTMP kinase [candidate division WWE3 bacterium RIFOXYD1_FULL_43_17]|uniref:Thymidylate kinase n=2 Tax=Katanobacteria TaxID=422282 RepID=A0A1F4XE20_UNCKA|nr:MAG: Thymidylate kinase [candidate division WWE3 bacterium GW2011_GWE1_41_27]OGC79885.1 MAG: dTMP kinase [candidate division WWE3 bacterium RIFOXYD1_FULL_43_17]
MLIAFEGGEGSGKGTQICLLKQCLESMGLDVLDIVEPGGTDVGKAIRDILLNRKDLDILGITEVFLFSASRAQQIRTVTRPALDQGKIVLSDRSFYSTYAYQGVGRRQSTELVETLTDFAVGDTTPDLVILLDISPEIGLARKKDQNEMNRLDGETLRFHKKVRNAYLTLAEMDPKLWRVIDGEASIEQIQARVKAIVIKALKIQS